MGYGRYFGLGAMIPPASPEATAYAGRSANARAAAFGTRPGHLDAAWDGMHGHFEGTYLSFETDRRPERLREAFPPGTLERLRGLKARHDPENVFRDNFNIPPAERRLG